jgi:hypothetical protein
MNIHLRKSLDSEHPKQQKTYNGPSLG